MPDSLTQIDAWFRPKLLKAIPKDIESWVEKRATMGDTDPSHIVLFHVLKKFSPGGANEKKALDEAVRNPQPCVRPEAAHKELVKWKDSVKRLGALGVSPPDIQLTYPAMESIFKAVFDGTEAQLQARWIALRNELSLPDTVNKQVMKRV